MSLGAIASLSLYSLHKELQSIVHKSSKIIRQEVHLLVYESTDAYGYALAHM